MSKRFRTTLSGSLVAVAAVAVTLTACGGGSDSSPVSDLAKFVPPDAAVYIQGSLKPSDDVQANADEITKKLTGSTLSDQLQSALAASDSEVDYEADVKPWLGDNAAMYADAGAFSGYSSESGWADSSGAGETTTMSSGTPFGAVIETSDADAAQAFIDKQAKSGTTGEYEGVSYSSLKGDESLAAIVDDNLIAADDVAGIKAMIDANKGDSLADNKGFSEVSDKVDDDSLVNVFVGNPASAAEAQGADLSGIYKAFGVDPEMAGAMFSLVPGENEISLRGYSADQPDLTAGDASDLIASFPADTVFAMGSGDLGKNATKVIESLDKEGIPGMLEPGQLGQTLDQISQQGIDVRSLVEDLQDFGLFVSGDDPRTLGGAMVLTSSDLDSVRSSFKAITGLIRLAGDNSVKPLGGGMTGLRVRTPELPGRPVVFAVGTDRIVIAIGMPAAKQALKGGGDDLGSDPVFETARDSLGGPLAMYGNPATLGGLFSATANGDPDLAQAGEILGQFEYMAAGSGSEDGSVELNLGLK